MYLSIFLPTTQVTYLRTVNIYPHTGQHVDLKIVEKDKAPYEIKGVPTNEYRLSCLLRPLLAGQSKAIVDEVIKKLEGFEQDAYDRGSYDSAEQDESL